MFENAVFKIYTAKNKYVCDGKLFKTEIGDDRFKARVSLKLPTAVYAVTAEIPFEIGKNDRIFGGGFQSWSYTREYKPKEIQLGANNAARLPFVRGISLVNGDYGFVDYGKGINSDTYTYIRKGDPRKNEADETILFGSLNENKGFTVFNFDFENQKLIIKKDLENVTLNDGDEIFDIFFARGGYEEVFDAYFAQMNIDKSRMKRLCGYTSWYNYFKKINESIILRDLESLAALGIVQTNIFQIDDGYQTATGDWLSTDLDKFPRGMKFIADEIHKKGLMAGIWLAPFSVSRKSRIFKEHKDWLIRTREGKLAVGTYAWGKSHTLDVYNPEVRNYLKTVFDTVLTEWGFDMVKLDFLYSECVPRDGKSRGEIMCYAMDFLRECVGDKLILGCGVPLGAAFGRVDMCRTSCDIHLKAKTSDFYNGLCAEIPSFKNAVTTNVFRRHLNERAFMLDPDVFFVRKDNLDYTEEQKELLLGVNNLTGGVLFVSDNAGDFDEEQKMELAVGFALPTAKITDAFMQGGVIMARVAKKDGEKLYILTFDFGIVPVEENSAETAYLNSIPDMAESIVEGLKAPKEEFVELDWKNEL